MLPISLMQQFSVWTVSCWPRTWLGRGSIVNKLQTLKVSPTSHCHMGHPATGGGGILQFEVLLEIPAFPAGVWMECVAPTAWAVPGRAERMSCTVLSLSLVCLTLLCTAPGRCWCSLAGEARWGLPEPPGCFACPSGSVLPSGAARGWNLAAPSVPSPRAGLDGCRRTVAFGKGMAGEGSCGCWKRAGCLTWDCSACPAEPEELWQLLAVQGKQGWGNGDTLNY